jgi:hypothetical protein
MTRTNLLASAAAVALLGGAGAAFADHPGGVGNTGGAGPINTISASTLPQGSGVIGVTVVYTARDALSDDTLKEAAEHAFEEGHDHSTVHSLDSTTAVPLSLAYGVTDNLTLMLRLPYVNRRGIREGHAEEHHPGDVELEVESHGSSSGIGDLSALAQWRFLNNRSTGTEAAILLGLKAPTGKTDESDQGEKLDAEFQPGSGSWDGLFGVALTQRVNAWSFDASALYTAVTEGTQSTDLGDRLTYGLAVSYRVMGMQEPSHAGHDHANHRLDTHAQGPALDLVLELNGEWDDKEESHGEKNDDSGGHVLMIAPGARLSIDKWSGFVSVGIPIVNDLNGIRSEPEWRLTSGVSVGF